MDKFIKKRTVVGLGGSGHEWATCVVSGDEMVAVSEERLSRLKYGVGSDLLSAASRQACLKELNLEASDVDHVVCCSLVPDSFSFALRRKKTVINHHLAHAYSTFAASGYKKAAVMVIDNSGSIVEGDKYGESRKVETISFYEGGPDGIRLIEKITGDHQLDVGSEDEFYQPGITSNSLGHFYRTASLCLGFSYQGPDGTEPFSEDGKTMGLSSYGDDRFVEQVGVLMGLSKDPLVRIDTDGIEEVFRECLRENTFENRAALAFAVQYNLERAILHCSGYLFEKTNCENLCIAGGVGLNSVANGMLQRKSPFKRVFVTPAPSDDGIALGCAYYGCHKLLGMPMHNLPRLKTAYLGPGAHGGSIDGLIEKYNLTVTKSDDLVDFVAGSLSRGLVLGMFQGRSEFGPRALGNRTILAAPFPGKMRDRLNKEIKKREWFRPYGPVVPLDDMDDIFDFKGESPFMSFVCPVRKPDLIPAATHVDGTARLQTLRREMNPLLYDILKAFGRYSGVPVLINTSFNYAGEPIVETPEDAVKSAIRLKLDGLVIDDLIVLFDNRETGRCSDGALLETASS